MSYVSQKRPFASMVDEEEPQETPQMSASDWQFCQNTMKVLKRNKRSVAFQNPVDPVQFNILDYFDIIKHPMDLGTIETKLEQSAYPTIEAFLADVQLIFDNCYMYNNEYDPVTLDAKKLEESFKRQLKKVPPHVNISHLLQDHNPGHASIPHVEPIINHTNYTTYPSYPVDPYPTDYPIEHSTYVPEPQPDIYAPDPLSPEQPYYKEERKPVEPHRPLTVKLQLKRSSGMPEDQQKRCEAIVKELKKPKYQTISWPFLNPVDAAAWGATDYYEIIKQPMDMSTYEKKLQNGEYISEEELAEDIRLMFRNCYAYNPPDHDINNFGHQLEQVFEKYWEKLHQGKKKSSSSRKRNLSHKEPAPFVVPVAPSAPPAPALAVVAPVSEKVIEQHHVTVDHTANAPAPTTSRTSAPAANIPSASSSASGRSNILRLKIPSLPKKEEIKKEEIKKPSLALSKEPPKLSINQHAPKLAISKPPSPKKTEVLHNQDKWAALAKNVTSLPPIIKKAYTAPKISPPRKPRISSPPHKPRISPPPPKKEAKGFDIGDLYSQIKNGARIREEEEREKQEKFEKEERIRLEKERAAAEERMRRIREFNIQANQLRIKERAERLEELSKNPTDISRQKMLFASFEKKLVRDNDWNHMYVWQRDTVNYRNLPVPPFVKRSGVNLSELRGKLYSKCVRLENSKSATAELEQDGDSDMDID